MIQYLFADRDGTLIFDKHYLSDPKGVELLPHVAEALQKLQKHNIKLFVVTNQSGIGRGYFKEQDLLACQNELKKQLEAFGVTILDMAFCPHAPEDNCSCRKPQLGMWEELQKKYTLDPQHCAMIGDKKEDLFFGINANFAYSCLVQTGKGLDFIEKNNILNKEKFFTLSEFSTENTQCFCAKTLENFVDFLIR